MNINLIPIDQKAIAADTPFMRDWTPRKAGDWICQGKSGAIYGTDGVSNKFYLVMPAPVIPAVCECGVKFTGGVHSDWCPMGGRVEMGDTAVGYAL